MGEGDQMGRGQVAVAILDDMQMLDQQVAAPRGVGQQAANLAERLRIDLAALGAGA